MGYRREVLAPGGRWRERPHDAVAVAEANPGFGVTLYRVAPLVHEAMVLITEKHEVLEARLAMRPVVAVVRLQMAPALASGETAGVAVARLDEPAERGRTVRRLRPTLTGRPSRSTCATTSVSHPSRRAVSGEISGPSSSSERPRPSAQARRRRRGRRRAPVARGSFADRDASARSSRAPTRAGRGGSTEAPSASACACGRSPLRHVPRGDAGARATRRFERLDQQRAVLGREPGRRKRAVVVEVVVDVLQLVRARRPPLQPGGTREAPARLRCCQRPRKSSRPPRTTVATLVSARLW